MKVTCPLRRLKHCTGLLTAVYCLLVEVVEEEDAAELVMNSESAKVGSNALTEDDDRNPKDK